MNRDDEALKALLSAAGDFEDANSSCMIHLRIASAYQKKKQYASAKKEFLRVIKEDTTEWQAKIAADELVSISQGGNCTFDQTEALQIAGAFYNAGSFAEAEKVLREHAGTSFKDAQLEEKYKVLFVKSIIRSKKGGSAESVIASVHNNAALSNTLMIAKADALWSLHRRGEALAIYRIALPVCSSPEMKQAEL